MSDDGLFDRFIPESARQTLGQLPHSFGDVRERVRAWFGSDPLDEAAALVDYARHAGKYARLQTSLLEFRFTVALILARRLEFFDALDEGAETVATLAEATGMTEPAVETFVAIFETRDLVEHDGETVRATDFTRTFLASDAPRSDTAMLDLLDAYTGALDSITKSLVSGDVPAELDVRGDPPATDAYLRAVNDYMDRAARELLARIRMPDVEHLIVGSMGVSFSSLALARWPDARVTYGCLENLTERIPALRNRYAVPPDRVVETHAHSGEPAGDKWGREAFDLVFLTKKMILDPEAGTGRAFARKALDVLEPGGVAIFWEALHRDDAETSETIALESFFDIGLNPNAAPRTRTEMREMLLEMGYDDVECVECLDGATSFAVARAP